MIWHVAFQRRAIEEAVVTVEAPSWEIAEAEAKRRLASGDPSLDFTMTGTDEAFEITDMWSD